MKNNKNRMILVLGFMAFLANGDNYAAATLLGNIAFDLNIDTATAAMSVTAYMLSFGIFTLIFGPLSDRFGKVRVVNTAAFGTAIFSMLGATAFNLPSLIFFRAVNGMFGAAIIPVTMALIGETIESENRQSAIGKVMGMAFLGAASATAIGGALAYFGSWRWVYLIYGAGELLLAIAMVRILERDKPVVEKFDIIGSYKTALTDIRFLRLVAMLFLTGLSVFGSFTYSGVLLQEKTGLNTLQIGLFLSIFGIGTVVVGRTAQKIRIRLKNRFLILAGVLGFTALTLISRSGNIALIGFGFLFFGMAFIYIQSTLVFTAQEKLPKQKGTAMSLASFNLFTGAAIGTTLNGWVMNNYGTAALFSNMSYVILAAGIITSIFVTKFEVKQRAKAAA